MSEQAPRMPEIEPDSPEISQSELGRESVNEKHETSPERSPEKNQENLEHIRHKVENLSRSKSEAKTDKPKQSHAPQFAVNKQLKKETLTKTIRRIQSKLPPTQRALSKVVHNRAVDKVSTAGEKTIARPIGILGGGALALLGSILSTWLAKQFGLPYNWLAFIVLFAIGYLLATTLEMIYKLLKPSKSR